MSGKQAQIMQDALAHAQHQLTAYKRLELVQPQVETPPKLTEAEMVRRATQCGDCD